MLYFEDRHSKPKSYHMRRPHGTVTISILEAIGDLALRTGDVFGAILEAPHGSSLRHLTHKARGRELAREKREYLILERRKVNAYLHRLKEQGLIAQEEKTWKITGAGKKKLKLLKAKAHLSLPMTTYVKEVAPMVTIISFDIPEKERFKRAWLRKQLHFLGFTLLQKSVWVGKVKLPKQFLDDLSQLHLLSKVHILGVTKTGTIQEI